jgi:hypothetical protein
MESYKFKVQVEKDGKILEFRGKSYFETEGSISEVLLKAKEYMIKNIEDEKNK